MDIQYLYLRTLLNSLFMDEYDQTEARRPPRRVLPPFYYLDNFKELLTFVEKHYGHVLLEAHLDFIGTFMRLPGAAQALYVRIQQRKGTLFRLADYRYPEIEDPSLAQQQLLRAGFARQVAPQDFAALLHYLNKDVLLAHAMSSGVKRSWKKADCIDYIFATVAAGDFINSLGAARPYVQGQVDQVDFIEFLYHGRLGEGAARLTLRDLGVVDTNDVTSFKARYQDYDEAYECYFFARELRMLARPLVGDIEILCQRQQQWPAPISAAGARLRDRLALQLGKQCEAQDLKERALEFYQAGESADCLRRTVRLFTELERLPEAKTYLEARLDAPRSDEEQLVAHDLYRRKFGGHRRSIATDFLQAAAAIELDEAWLGSPERGAQRYYIDQGYQAFRTENGLWRSLFGLLFWDLLFGEQHGVVHSPFDYLPADLSAGVFYARHARTIEARLARLDNRSATLMRLLRTSTQHYGRKNSVFRWRRDGLAAINTLIECASPTAIAGVLRRLCQDYRQHRAGYPDLMLEKDGAVRFVELKAAGDQVRRQQLLALNFMNAAGLPADVVRVDWCVDPDQVYVVVDVETTGGRGPQHRVTEIGAVKVRQGAVTDRFSSLINPQRLVPASITRITRITNQMVENAPLFADVADSFKNFLEDAIFCAHNVNFDYGFLRQEFARLGRAFRYPKLCTCASMRKLYPGHRSYSLAALAAAYEIPLENHHRALCDAEAAAELLLLVNERRRSGRPDQKPAARQAQYSKR